VIDAVAVVACGVLATVESPEPQPLNITASKTPTVRGSARHGRHHTSRNRTGIANAGVTGMPQSLDEHRSAPLRCPLGQH
jgi:hypothetical protein